MSAEGTPLLVSVDNITVIGSNRLRTVGVASVDRDNFSVTQC